MKKPHIQWPEQWLRRRRIPSIGFSYSGKDFIISMSLYTLSVVLCLILRGASQDGDTGYVYMIFLLDVFLTALLTEGFSSALSSPSSPCSAWTTSSPRPTGTSASLCRDSR